MSKVIIAFIIFAKAFYYGFVRLWSVDPFLSGILIGIHYAGTLPSVVFTSSSLILICESRLDYTYSQEQP